MNNMSSVEIPGYYYDKTKKKYFKVQKNHLAPQDSSYSYDAIKQENELAVARKRKRDCEQRERAERIERSKTLRNPLLGGAGLTREIGLRRDVMGVGMRAWAVGLERKTNIKHMGHGTISQLVFDKATGSFAFSVDQRMICAVPYRFDGSGEQLYRRQDGAHMYSEITSLALSASRVLMTVARGDEAPSSVQLDCLVFPDTIDPEAEPRLSSSGLIKDVSCTLHQNFSTFWASSPRPGLIRSDFALATNKGTFLIMENETGWVFGPSQQYGKAFDRSRDVLAVDWMGPNLILNGCRDGTVRLWDVRTTGLEGTSLRLKHSSKINHVRSLDQYSMVVAGLQHRLCAYDLRYLPSSETSHDAGPTTPSVLFPAYQNNEALAIGFDVHNYVVAAGTVGIFGERMQLFDAKDGKRIRALVDKRMVYGNSEAPSCIRFIGGEDSSSRPRLMTTNQKVIEEWSW